MNEGGAVKNLNVDEEKTAPMFNNLEAKGASLVDTSDRLRHGELSEGYDNATDRVWANAPRVIGRKATKNLNAAVRVIAKGYELGARATLKIEKSVLAKTSVNHLGRLARVWQEMARTHENVNERDGHGCERSIMAGAED
jgi:hypothetical protein